VHGDNKHDSTGVLILYTRIFIYLQYTLCTRMFIHLPRALHPHVALDPHVVDAHPQRHVRRLVLAHIGLHTHTKNMTTTTGRGGAKEKVRMKCQKTSPNHRAFFSEFYLCPASQRIEEFLEEAPRALQRAEEVDGAFLPCVCMYACVCMRVWNVGLDRSKYEAGRSAVPVERCNMIRNRTPRRRISQSVE
jgi:hypothetical protein